MSIDADGVGAAVRALEGLDMNTAGRNTVVITVLTAYFNVVIPRMPRYEDRITDFTITSTARDPSTVAPHPQADREFTEQRDRAAKLFKSGTL